jgi:hypothetical protein
VSDQGSTYNGFVDAELDRELRRRDTIDRRASTTVTSSAAIVTLSLAIASMQKLGNASLPVGRVPLVLTAAGFLTAALLAVVAGFGWAYEVPELRTIEDMLRESWTDTEPTARNECSRLTLSSLASLRRGNNRKMQLLTAAQTSQCLAIMFVVLALWTALG